MDIHSWARENCALIFPSLQNFRITAPASVEPQYSWPGKTLSMKATEKILFPKQNFKVIIEFG